MNRSRICLALLAAVCFAPGLGFAQPRSRLRIRWRRGSRPVRHATARRAKAPTMPISRALPASLPAISTTSWWRSGTAGGNIPPMNYLLEYLPEDYLQRWRSISPRSGRSCPPPTPDVSSEMLAHGELLVTQGDFERDIPACAKCHGSTPHRHGAGDPWPARPPRHLYQRAARRLALRHPHRHGARLHADRGGHLTEDDVKAVAGVSRVAARAGRPAPVAKGSLRPAVRLRERAAMMTVRRCLPGNGLRRRGVCWPRSACRRQPRTTRPTRALIEKGANISRAPATASPATPRPKASCSLAAAPMPTPFGTLYTSNITPDNETGIGNMERRPVLHDDAHGPVPGRRPALSGDAVRLLYQGHAADSDAIFAYLRSIPPVKQANRPHDLRFPYNNRSLILGWRTLYFTEGEYKPDPKQSDEWNRGAYLVEGLGHCAMCHTAINALGGSSESQAFQGGLIPMQNWYAPSLTSNKEAGPRRLEPEGNHRLAEDRRLGARRGLRADGRGRLQQPAIYERRRHPRHGRLSQEPRPGQPATIRRPQISRASESSLLVTLGKTIYDTPVRELPWRGGAGQAAALSAARRQPVDPDGVGRQSDPHGAEWRLPAGHRGQSDALRHAAVRAVPVGRRGCRCRHLHPHSLGQSRRARQRPRSERASLRTARLRPPC